jgi:hypothetical protein
MLNALVVPFNAFAPLKFHYNKPNSGPSFAYSKESITTIENFWQNEGIKVNKNIIFRPNKNFAL